MLSFKMSGQKYHGKKWANAIASVMLILCFCANAQQREEIHIDKVSHLSGEGDIVQAEQITARWRAYRIDAERLEGNTRTGIYRLFESIRLQGSDLYAGGQELTLDLHTNRWTLLGGRATLQPAFTNNRLLEPLYVQGETLTGQERLVEGNHLQATTCDLDHPHFHWDARTLSAVEGERAVLRDVRLRVLGRTILRVPYVVVPLRDTGDTSPLPDVGYSDLEGWYLRYALAYLLLKNYPGTARFDLMQRRGVGFNIEQGYAQGRLNLYWLRDHQQATQSLTGRWSHTQNWGILQTRWSGDYRRNSYLIGDSTAWNLQTEWLLPTPTSQTRLTFTENRSLSTGYENISRVWNLQETRALRKLQVNWSGTYQESETLFGSTRTGTRQWNVRSNLLYPVGSTHLQLDYERILPIGAGSTVFGGLERLPEFSLNTPLTGFLKNPPNFARDSQLRISIGNFVEGFFARVRRQRYALDWQGRWGTGTQTRTNLFYGFKQTFYSDDTAQYVLQSNWEQRFQWGKNSAFSLRWNYIRPYGYSPLNFDRAGTYNLLSADLRTHIGGGWNWGMATTYDLLARKQGRDAWSLVNILAEYQPTEWLLWRHQITYDPNRERFVSIQSDLRWRFGDSQLTVATRYDAQRARWGRLFVRADAIKWGRSRISAILQYNGYLNRVESRQLLWVYDLHCAELEIRYIDNPFSFRSDTGIQLFLRLKAFPSFSRYGTGTFGTPVGGTGSDL